jgi:hypothetical protein
MKDLANVISGIGKSLAVLTLVGAGIIGCATYSQSSKDSRKDLIDLGNGYYARTDKAERNIDLATSVFLGEVLLIKKSNGEYARINTSRYDTTGEMFWEAQFYESCVSADANGDNILEESETKDLLDMAYDAIEKEKNEIQWIEEDD